MLEFVCKILLCLSMLAVYRYVTSTNELIVVVGGYFACVFSYYYFDIIRGAIDDFLNYFNLNGSGGTRVNDTMQQPKVTGYFMNKNCNKISNSPVAMAHVSNKMFNTLCNTDKSYQKENIMVYEPKLNIQNSARSKPEYKSGEYLPSILKSNGILINRSKGNKSKTYLQMSLLDDQSGYNETKNELLQDTSNANELPNEEIRSDNNPQTSKGVSRKRNYTLEEAERNGSTPKKSRKNEMKKNFMSTQQKRTHNDCSNDSVEDENRKKRCETKYKRTHEDSSNDSGEDDTRKKRCDETDMVSERIARIEDTTEDENENEFSITETPPLSDDEDGEYVKVASGKILNRINCTYRKKLNHNKIDPISVITIEPELVDRTSYANDDTDEESYMDDEMMKESLLKSLIDDIERKGERDESVIFFENSIIEEIAKREGNLDSQKAEVDGGATSSKESTVKNLLEKSTPAVVTSAPSFSITSPTV